MHHQHRLSSHPIFTLCTEVICFIIHTFFFVFSFLLGRSRFFSCLCSRCRGLCLLRLVLRWVIHIWKISYMTWHKSKRSAIFGLFDDVLNTKGACCILYDVVPFDFYMNSPANVVSFKITHVCIVVCKTFSIECVNQYTSDPFRLSVLLFNWSASNDRDISIDV